jgi:FixJ family two-component response regulator
MQTTLARATPSNMSKKRIIVGEDDQAIRGALVDFLKSLGYEVVEAATCAGIREAFRDSFPDAAVLDYSLPDGTALDLLPHLKQSHPSVPVILLTGNGTIQLAVRAIKRRSGAVPDQTGGTVGDCGGAGAGTEEPAQSAKTACRQGS